MFTYVSFIATIAVPQKYAPCGSPSGRHKLVVLRAFDATDEKSIAQRKAARLEAYPDSGEDTRGEDFIVVFRAYPKVAGLFYRSKADVQGEVYLAYGAARGVIQPAEGRSAEPVPSRRPTAP